MKLVFWETFKRCFFDIFSKLIYLLRKFHLFRSYNETVADPIKLFFANGEFLCFLLLSLAILLLMIFYICNKTLKLNSKNWKMKKKKFYRIGYSRAKCGLRKLLIWPGKPQILFVKSTLWMCYNILTLALGDVQKKIFLARHEIWVVHPWAKG